MNHGVDSLERIGYRVSVVHVGVHEPRLGGNVHGSGSSVYLLDERIDDRYVVSLVEQKLDHVGADEAGSPGHEHLFRH